MFSIKKMLVDLYDSRTAQSCSASIGDIMNLRRNVEHNQFLATTLDEPEYMIEDSKAVSKRIRDIKNILEMRYGMEFVSQIYFSQSCLEGKEIFDKIKNDFIE